MPPIVHGITDEGTVILFSRVVAYTNLDVKRHPSHRLLIRENYNWFRGKLQWYEWSLVGICLLSK